MGNATRNTLQRTAVHCSVLQRTATHGCATHSCATHSCATHYHTLVVLLQLGTWANHSICATTGTSHPGTQMHDTLMCDTLQHTATRCNTLQHAATHCNTLQHTATHCNTLQHAATHCNTLFVMLQVGTWASHSIRGTPGTSYPGTPGLGRSVPASPGGAGGHRARSPAIAEEDDVDEVCDLERERWGGGWEGGGGKEIETETDRQRLRQRQRQKERQTK